jgi:UDP-glucose 4-epimerase
MNAQRILITGGCGFVGSNLVRRLIAEDRYVITVVDNLSRGKHSNLGELARRVEMLELDINSPDLDGIFQSRNFAVVVHLSAIHYIPYCESHPTETCRTNIEGTQAVLDLSIKYGVKRFFLASSGAVYASAEKPHKETDDLSPLDIYGLTKITNESQVKLAARKGDCSFIIGRIFNVIGPGETNPHLVPELIERAKQSKCIEVGNVQSKRDYIHVADVCEAIRTLTLSARSQVATFNIGTGKPYDVVEVIECLSHVMGTKLEYKSTVRFSRKVDRPLLEADISRIQAEYGWRPRFTLEDGIRDAFRHSMPGPSSSQSVP